MIALYSIIFRAFIYDFETYKVVMVHINYDKL